MLLYNANIFIPPVESDKTYRCFSTPSVHTQTPNASLVKLSCLVQENFMHVGVSERKYNVLEVRPSVIIH